MTFKGPVVPGPFKSREEIETGIEDPMAAATLVDRLGFEAILIYEKRRESWSIGSCRIELDELPHLGLFVEIEGPDNSSIADVRDRIGLAGATHERASYIGLLLAHCKAHGLTNRVISIENG